MSWPGLSLTYDITGGITTSNLSILSILIHGLLSLSSLKFIIPKERIAKKPMIWQEFRAHNIIFAWRSITCCFYMWLGMKFNLIKLSVVLCSFQIYNSLYAADLTTNLLRLNNNESTTGTMPYWEGCSIHTQNKFKTFYAYSQYLATLSCLSCSNIIWPFIVLLPIQLASFLMTLVRKGLLSTKGYHYIYTASLCLPYIVGTYHTFKTPTYEVLFMFGVGSILYKLRTIGINKYKIWLPVIFSRIGYEFGFF